VTQLVNLVANALVVEKKVVVPVEEVPAPAVAAGFEGYRILVIDDEPDFVTFVSAVLEDNGATVFKAYNGDEAIELARKEKPHLMTLDLSMPGKSGDEVFEEMRNDPELKSIPVCVITGQPELRKLIYDRPVPPPEGYLNKPADEETLLLNIRKILKLPHGAKAIDAKSTQAQTEAPRG
jgi:CheY-like chemotaxis protein